VKRRDADPMAESGGRHLHGTGILKSRREGEKAGRREGEIEKFVVSFVDRALHGDFGASARFVASQVLMCVKDSFQRVR
jgi:hypothetical protein